VVFTNHRAGCLKQHCIPDLSWGSATFRAYSSLFFHLRLQIVLQTDLVDELDLGLEPVDVLFSVVKDFLEQIARNVVAHRFAISNGFGDGAVRRRLELQVTGKNLVCRLLLEKKNKTSGSLC